MDKATQIELTNALDKAIVTTAEQQLDRLCKGLADKQVAEGICGALNSLRGLRDGKMPEYSEWDSLIYLLWYQPDRINLAYSLVQIIAGNWNVPLEGV